MGAEIRVFFSLVSRVPKLLLNYLILIIPRILLYGITGNIQVMEVRVVKIFNYSLFGNSHSANEFV